jgi:transposase-like protein
MSTAKRYTPAEREALIAEYNLGGLPITAFCKQPGKPAYQVFKKWLEDASGTAPTSKAPTSGKAASLLAEFEEVLAQEETREQKYLRFLKGKREELKAELAQVEAEIAKLAPEQKSTLETEGD